MEVGGFRSAGCSSLMVSGQSKMEPQHSDSPTPEMPSGGAISRREKPGTGKEGPEGPMPPTLGPLGPRQHPLLAGHSGGTLAQLIPPSLVPPFQIQLCVSNSFSRATKEATSQKN